MKAAIGTPKTAPAMPPTEPAAVMTSITATGCRDTALDIMKGWSRLDSTCWTTRMMTSMMIAEVAPLYTSATRTAMAPDARAPMMGTKAAKKVMTAMGTTIGIPRKNAPSEMPTASMAATWIWVRT